MKAEKIGLTIRTAVVLVLLLGDVSSSYALDAFWQGRRSSVWEHGIHPKTGKSNWYSRAPLRGDARRVPDGIAFFAEGAAEHRITIAEDVKQKERPKINLMVFRKSSKSYKFTVRTFFTVINGGIRNFDRLAFPTFFIENGAGIIFRGNARLVSHGGDWISAVFHISEDGRLFFDDNSRGGKAHVANHGGEVEFAGSASAGRMRIFNRDTGLGSSSVRFYERSTGGSADFINERDTFLDFSNTRGPVGGRVTAGSIDNNGRLGVGTTALVVQDRLRLGTRNSQALLSIDRAGGRHGSIQVKNDVWLGGTLLATGFFRLPAGRFVIIRAGGRILGKFDREVLNGARIEYGAKTVVLVVGK